MKKIKKCSKGNVKQLSGLVLTLTVACTSVASVTATPVSNGTLKDTLEYEVLEEGHTEEGQTQEKDIAEAQIETLAEGDKLTGFSEGWGTNGIGSWKLNDDGSLTSNNKGGSDALYMSPIKVDPTDTYVVETEIKIQDGDAAGIVFASANEENYTDKWYCFSANGITGQAKVFGPGVPFKETTIGDGTVTAKTFTLKVEVIGGKQVNTYVNDILFESSALTEPFTGGYVGVMTWQSNATFNNIKLQKFEGDYSLKSLEVTDKDNEKIALTPKFSQDKFTYKATVPNETETVKLNCTTDNDNMIVSLNGKQVDDIEEISLVPGNNVIIITLTDENENITFYTKVSIYRNREEKEFDTNLENFKSYGGDWSNQGSFVSGNNISAGDAFYMSDIYVGSTDTYAVEGEFEILDGQAAGIVFAAPNKDNPGKKWYCLNIDKSSKVSKLLGSGSVANEYPLSKEELASDIFKLRVEVIGGKQVNAYLNGKLIASKIDEDFPGGYIGIMTFNSETYFNSINLHKFEGNGYHLKNLEVDNGDIELNTKFNKDVFLYRATVPYEKSSIKLNLTPYNADEEFTISVNDKVIEGTDIPLEAGKNNTIKITSIDEVTGINFITSINIYRRNKETYKETYRPQYHFSPEIMWCNDPNGMVYFEGEWHLFYQYHPDDKIWGPMHWGHAVSTDLIHWEELPIALAPDKLGTIFSGSAVVDKNNTSGFFDGIEGGGLVAIFTYDAPEGQKQAIAYSTDKGRTWTKYEGNPVISGVPIYNDDENIEGNVLEDTAFRDPKVFWHEESQQWMMVVAGGPVRFYSSKNLIDWHFESGYDNNHPQYRPEGVNSIYTECPDFYKLEVGDTGEYKWILNCGGRFYMIGDFEYDEKVGGWAFVPDSNEQHVLNYAKDSYAAMTYYGTDGENGTPDGRRIMINWMNNWDYCNDLATITNPYNGCFTLQHEMTLEERNGEYVLIQTPIEEYKSLRQTENATKINTTLTPDSENPLANFKGDQYEIVAEFTPDEDAEVVGFKLRTGGDQETLVYYNLEDGKMYLDRTKSGEYPNDKFPEVYSQETSMTEDGKIKMHIYVDWSSIEVFGNDGETVGSALVFPEPTSVGTEIYTVGGNSEVNATIYPLDGIWNESESLGGSSGGSSSSSSSTTTNKTENPDSSITTTVTNLDGSIVETTTKPDGSTIVIEKAQNGDVTTTEKDTQGNTTTTIEKANGINATTTVDSKGNTDTKVNIPQSVVSQNVPVSVPMPISINGAIKDSNAAYNITIEIENNNSARLEIPIENIQPGTVAVIVREDGTEEVIKTTIAGEDSIFITIEGNVTIKVIDNSKDFVDVSNNFWGSTGIDFSTSREIFAGTSAETFSPDDDMNRAMVVTVLARLNGQDTTGGSTWYEQAAAWAVENGISDGTNLNGAVTREQLVSMIYRYAGSPVVTSSVDNFSDSGNISGYAVNAMAWAIENGVISGMGDSTLNPQGNATRAQVATIMMNFITNINK